MSILDLTIAVALGSIISALVLTGITLVIEESLRRRQAKRAEDLLRGLRDKAFARQRNGAQQREDKHYDELD